MGKLTGKQAKSVINLFLPSPRFCDNITLQINLLRMNCSIRMCNTDSMGNYGNVAGILNDEAIGARA